MNKFLNRSVKGKSKKETSGMGGKKTSPYFRSFSTVGTPLTRQEGRPDGPSCIHTVISGEILLMTLTPEK